MVYFYGFDEINEVDVSKNCDGKVMSLYIAHMNKEEELEDYE